MLLVLAYHYAHRGGGNQAQTKPHRLPLIVIFDQVKITIQTSHSSVRLGWHPGSLHRNKSVHVLGDKEKYQSSWKKNKKKKKNSSISNTWFVHQRALIIFQLKGILLSTNLLSYLIVGENVMRFPQ